MSKIFYDHLIELTEVNKFLRTLENKEEKEELWQIIDEIIHHRIMGLILDHLPREHHEDFLEKFASVPFSSELLVYINLKTDRKMEEIIKKEAKKIEVEILKEIRKN